MELLKRKDPKRNPIIKDRYCFVWHEQYFELDVFQKNLSGLSMMEIELMEKGQMVRLPDFVPITREVTNEPAYKNSNLALKKKEAETA